MNKQNTNRTFAAPKFKRKLARRLSIILILLAVSVFVVSLSTAFRHSQELIHKEVMEHSVSVLNTSVQRVNNYIRTIETAAKSNVWLLNENFTPDSLQSISRHIVRLNKSVLSCSVSTEPDVFPECGRYFSVYSVNEGDTIITVREPDDFEYFQKKWYRNAVESGKPCWVDPFSDFSDGNINVEDAVGSYCIPLRPNGRHIEGVVSVDFSFHRLAETILANEHPYPNSYYVLLGEGGRYLVHPDKSLLFKKTIFTEPDSVTQPELSELAHEMVDGKKGLKHVVLNGELCHVCYAPIHGTHASLALICPEEEVMVEHNYLHYLIIAIIFLGMLFIWWLTHHVVKQNIQPINQLLAITNKIADGDYSETIPLSPRKDAIANMQNSFAKMQKAIVAHINAINQASEELQQQNDEMEKAMQEAAESSESRRAFVRGVFRQIRTPLNIIEGLTNVLRKNIAALRNGGKAIDEGEMRNMAGTLKYNAYYLKRMMFMLYDISDTRAKDATLYELTDEVLCNDIAQESINFTLDFFPSVKVRLQTEVPDSAHLHTNRLHLLRTLRELLYNAAKFSDGNNIVMRVEEFESSYRFIIQDVGPGLPLQSQDLISQPFAKVETLSEGLGLGLPLCKRYITALGGQLIYDTTYTSGCRFIVEMPRK